MNTYLYLQNQQEGPFSDDQLCQMWKTGQINPETLYWREGFSQWQSLRMIQSEIGFTSAAQPPPLPTQPPVKQKKKFGCLALTLLCVGIIGISFVGLIIIAAVMTGSGASKPESQTPKPSDQSATVEKAVDQSAESKQPAAPPPITEQSQEEVENARNSLPLAVGDIVTASGETYKACKITKYEPDGLTITHEAGVGKLKFADLPEALRDKFGYSEVQATTYRNEQQKKVTEAKVAASSARYIPGFTAVDLHGNLTNKGFKLEKTFLDDEALYTCTMDSGGTQYRAEAYGKGATEIISVRGTVIDGSGNLSKVAKEFLGYLGSLPYDGAIPDRGRQWVESNIDKSSATTIGGVKFEIIAKGPGARILIISKQ